MPDALDAPYIFGPMAGVLPFEVEVNDAPQGHGYAELLVDAANPFFPVGMRLRGHEFHYSRIVLDGAALPAACAPEWAEGMIRAALNGRVVA